MEHGKRLKTQDFFLPGPLPGMNEIVAAAKQLTSVDLQREWSNIIIEIAKQRQLYQILSPVFFHFVWREPTRRRNFDDIASGKKFVLDGLFAAGILPGNGWKYIEGWSDTFILDSKHPGVWVEIDQRI